jgi:Transcription factor Tfb4
MSVSHPTDNCTGVYGLQVDIGYACSVCLSVFCQRAAECSTCGTAFAARKTSAVKRPLAAT